MTILESSVRNAWCTPGEPTLYGEIPLHHVIAVRVWFNVGVFQASGGISRKGFVRKQPLKPFGRIGDCKERGTPAVQCDCRIKHGKDVKHSETATHSGLAVPEGVPRKSYSGLEIAKRRVREVRRDAGAARHLNPAKG